MSHTPAHVVHISVLAVIDVVLSGHSSVVHQSLKQGDPAAALLDQCVLQTMGEGQNAK
jgi:hypothetical protein